MAGGEMTTVRATVVAVGDGRWWMVAAGVPGRRVFDSFDDAYGAASGYVSSFGRGVVVDRRGTCTVFSPAGAA
jgi:hypothetical protein